MKQFAIVAVMMLAAVGASAQTTTTVTNNNPSMPALGSNGNNASQQQQQASSNANAGVTGSNNFVIEASNIPTDTSAKVHQTIDGTQTLKNTPSVSGPSLTTSNDTCMGAASGSVNGPGFGVGFGKTYKDDNCVMLKNARELWNMGMKAAAMARLCMDPDNKAALEMTDFKCPQTVKAERDAASKTVANSNVAQPELTDPIVRRRMGLPALAQ